MRLSIYSIDISLNVRNKNYFLQALMPLWENFLELDDERFATMVVCCIQTVFCKLNYIYAKLPAQGTSVSCIRGHFHATFNF